MAESGQPQRSLGLFDTTMLVSGSMIGSGIFIVSADMARNLGSPAWLLICWVITGIITVFAALSYGELAGMMPNAGGQYVYLKKAYSPMIGFLYGWTTFMVIQTGVIAAVAVAFAKYTGIFVPFFDEKEILLQIGSFKVKNAQLLAIGLIILLTWLNMQGIKNGKLIQRVFTSTKLIALFIVIVTGIYFGMKTEVWQHNFAEPWKAFSTAQNKEGAWSISSLSGIGLMGAMGVAMIGSLFSSDSWNNVTYIAGEIKEPHKNIPLGLFFGTCIVTFLYIMANIAYMCLLPVQGNPEATTVMEQGIQFAQNDRVGTAAVSVILGDTATYLMAALIMISTFGCNNGLILAGSRLFQTMAGDGLFFKKAADLNSKQVPAYALIIQAAWACVLCLSGSYGDLLDYATFASLVFYIVTIGAIFILRKKDPDAPRPYRAFGYPLVPFLYIIVATAICIDLLIFKTSSTGLGLLIVFLGIPVYYLARVNKQTDNA